MRQMCASLEEVHFMVIFVVTLLTCPRVCQMPHQRLQFDAELTPSKQCNKNVASECELRAVLQTDVPQCLGQRMPRIHTVRRGQKIGELTFTQFLS